MSGECDECGEHTIDCQCDKNRKESEGIRVPYRCDLICWQCGKLVNTSKEPSYLSSEGLPFCSEKCFEEYKNTGEKE